jgi:hypothetical protein
MAGIGHVELLEGKIQDARNHFEAAISLSQGKNIAVLNAIGFANGNPDSKNGDAKYAIDKLKQAPFESDPKKSRALFLNAN